MAERLSLLRPDGLGPFDFASPAGAVEAWLARQLGAPDVAVVEPGEGGWPLMSCTERRFAYWSAAGLIVGFSDFHGIDSVTGVMECGDGPHLAGWYVEDDGLPWFVRHANVAADIVPPPVTLRLTTVDGIGLRSSAQELRDAYPTVEFGEWYVGEYSPTVFHTADGMSGSVGWNPVGDVQQALNDRGADLVVDGILGPRTRAALVEFQIANGITELHGEDLGPQTLAALEVTVPASAPVEFLQAGDWAWAF